jgi:hypothetical protein
MNKNKLMDIGDIFFLCIEVKNSTHCFGWYFAKYKVISMYGMKNLHRKNMRIKYYIMNESLSTAAMATAQAKIDGYYPVLHKMPIF